MKKISNLFSKKLLFLFGTATILFAPVFVLADGYGLDATASAAGLKSADLTVLVGNIIGSALSLVGVVFFILMLYGGFVWMIARGKEEKVNKAKDTITAAVIGLIIVFASYALTNFIFSSLEGQTGGGNTNNTSNTDEYTCTQDSDCISGETCQNGFCLSPAIPISYTGFCYVSGGCTNSNECSLGLTCGGSSPTMCGIWGVKSCNTAADCPSPGTFYCR